MSPLTAGSMADIDTVGSNGLRAAMASDPKRRPEPLRILLQGRCQPTPWKSLVVRWWRPDCRW